MKTLCLIDSISRANGGIFEAESRLQPSLRRYGGVDVQVMGLGDSFTTSDKPAWAPLVPEVFKVTGPQAFGYAPRLADALLRADADLLYSVGLWKYPSMAALQWACRTNKPLMVAPHGMLDPWALQNSGIKKRIAAWAFQDAHLKKAACIRALCSSEATSIRAYGLKNPICVIPNGIDLPAPLERSRAEEIQNRLFPGRKVLLYLGRLHPKKGLANLITAWSRIDSGIANEWILAIAGWDQGGHEVELKRQAASLGIYGNDVNAQNPLHQGAVIFLGPKFNEDKVDLYIRCDGFVLPSVSEGLPMVILEAWAHGKPVIMTPKCNLPEGFAAHAAVRIDSSAEGIAHGLNQFLSMSSDDRNSMGANGLSLVMEHFTWSKVASEMKLVYEWVLGRGNKPVCITVD